MTQFPPHILGNRKVALILQWIAIFGLIFVAIRRLLRFDELFMGHASDQYEAGFTDCLQYWSAFRVWIEQGNPYDETVMRALQSLIRKNEFAIMMWNPPWLLVLFSPILALSFVSFAQAWFACSLAVYLITLWFLDRELQLKSMRDIRFIFLALAFPTLWSVLEFGQLGAWLSAGVCLIFIGLEKKRPLLLGIGALLLSLKPHLFAFFLVSVGIVCIKRKAWLLLTALFSLPALMLAVTEALTPGITLTWFRTIAGITPPHTTPRPVDWITTTIPSKLCELLGIINAYERSIIAFAFLVVVGLVSMRALKRFKDREALIFILSASFLFGPFAWIFDYLAFLPCIAMLWPAIAKDERLCNFVLISSLILAISITVLFQELQNGIFPLLLLFSALFEAWRRVVKPIQTVT